MGKGGGSCGRKVMESEVVEVEVAELEAVEGDKCAVLKITGVDSVVQTRLSVDASAGNLL